MSEIEDQADSLINTLGLPDDDTSRNNLVVALSSTTNKATRDNFLKNIQKKDPDLFNAVKKISDDLQTIENLLRLIVQPRIINPTVYQNPPSSIDPVLQPDFFDDFIGYAASGGRGVLNWTPSSNGAGTTGFFASIPGHPGIVELVTSAVNGITTRIALGPTLNDQPIHFLDFDRWVWIVSPDATQFSSLFRCGAIQNFYTLSAAIQDGFYFECTNTAVAVGNWIAKVVFGGVHNDIDTGIPQTNTFQKLECIRRDDDGLDWFVDNVHAASHDPLVVGTSISSTFNFGAAVQNSAAAVKRWLVDFTRLKMKDFSILYPDALEAGNRHS